ncbi:MAG: hypothetical protein R3F31_21720 [Verrucomicrobiales bacterium]
MLHLQLRAPGDSLAMDNDTLMPLLPRVRPVVVALVGRGESQTRGTDQSRHRSLSGTGSSLIQSEGEMDVFVVSPESWPPKHPVDVAVFDHWLPTVWPTDIPCIVINPDGRSGPIKAKALDIGIPYDGKVVVDEGHPVLFRVSSSRVALRQTCVFDLAGSLEPLWIAGNELCWLPVKSPGSGW